MVESMCARLALSFGRVCILQGYVRHATADAAFIAVCSPCKRDSQARISLPGYFVDACFAWLFVMDGDARGRGGRDQCLLRDQNHMMGQGGYERRGWRVHKVGCSEPHMCERSVLCFDANVSWRRCVC